MEDKKINEQESLDLIMRMIQNTKCNFEKGNGNIFIIWGSCTIIVAFLVAIMVYLTQNVYYNWLWMLIPLIGNLWTYIAKSRTKTPRKNVYTKMDKLIQELWLLIGGVALVIPLIFFIFSFFKPELIFSNWDELFIIIPFIEMLVCSIGLAITGSLLDFKPLSGGGRVGIFLSIVLLLALPGIIKFVWFALWGLVSMVIPGIKLNHYIKKNQNHV